MVSPEMQGSAIRLAKHTCVPSGHYQSKACWSEKYRGGKWLRPKISLTSWRSTASTYMTNRSYLICHTMRLAGSCLNFSPMHMYTINCPRFKSFTFCHSLKNFSPSQGEEKQERSMGVGAQGQASATSLRTGSGCLTFLLSLLCSCC